MSTIRWNTQDMWESYMNSLNIDTTERPDYLRKMYVNDSFNNNDLSTLRWKFQKNHDISYSETTNLYIDSTGTGADFEIKGNYYYPDYFESYLEFSDLHTDAVLEYTISGNKDASIQIDSANIRAIVDGSLVGSSSRITDGKLYIYKYSSDTFGFLYGDSSGVHELWTGTIATMGDEIYGEISITSSTSSIRLAVINKLYVSGYDETAGHLVGYAKYKFKTSGTITGVYLDATDDPEERILIQLSQNNSDWYGKNGIDTYYTETNFNAYVPSSSDQTYWYRVYIMPSTYDETETFSAYSRYVELYEALTNSAYSKYFENNESLILHSAYSKFLVNNNPLIVHSANSQYQESVVSASINLTDTFTTFYGILLRDGQYIGTPIPSTAGMDGVAIFAKYDTGHLVVGTSSATVNLPSETLTIVDTSGTPYVRIRSVGETEIEHVGVIGIWL